MNWLACVTREASCRRLYPDHFGFLDGSAQLLYAHPSCTWNAGSIQRAVTR